MAIFLATTFEKVNLFGFFRQSDPPPPHLEECKCKNAQFFAMDSKR